VEVTPGYKQTEVGMLPEAWGVVDFVSFGRVIDGDRGVQYPGVGDFRENGYCLFLNAGNVTKEGFRFAKRQFISAEKDKKLNKGKLARGDVVLTTRGTLGNFAYFSADVPFDQIRINSGMVILRNTSETVSNTYEYLVLRSRIVESQIERLSFGSAQPQLTVKNISTLKVPLPPTKAEQEAIVEALSDAGALTESLVQLIAKKRDLKKGVMQELFRPKNNWVERRLGNTAVLKARIGWQGLTIAEYLKFGNFYLVTGTDFKDGFIDWSNCHYVEELRYRQDRNIQLRNRDVLVTKDGTIGKVALVNHLDKPATLNSGVFVIRPIEDAFHPEFFYYLLYSSVFTKFLTQLSAGSTISHLYQKDFVNFIYKTPTTITEQATIAGILYDMDAELAALEAKLAKARSIEQGMVQELLNGRIRLV
jgi:type I restriction enzyme S subunit